MTAQPSRYPAPTLRVPRLHELPPLRIADRHIELLLSVRRDEDGAWRARLRFAEQGIERETAEIFCGLSETELWQSVAGLRDHHIRALYLSLA
jgi:hypothetical protein